MSKTKISEFSTTPGNNTDINGINIAEGCAPSGINNAIRELMSDLKEWQSGAMDVYVIPQGTAAAPGIQLYGDLDTGLYGFAANQLGVAVGGASAGYFSSAGWVGNVVATTVDLTNIEVTNIKAKDGTAAITIADSTGIVSVSTVLDLTTIEVTNIKAKDGTASASIADSTGVMTIASSILTTTDINGGTIDGATIATSDITVGAGKTLNVSAGTMTLADDQISGDKIQGGTIGSTTITTLTSTTVNASTVDTTNIEVTNVKAKDGTSAFSISDTTGAVDVGSALTASGVVTFSATTQNIGLGTSQTSGTFTVGGASQTGAITVDQSTKTHTLNVASGATENAATKTVNVATGGVSGSTTTITIGSENGTSTTVNGATSLNASDGSPLFVGNSTASTSGSSYLTFKNKDGPGVYRNVARVSGKTTDNGGNGEMLFETYASGVAYKGLKIDNISGVSMYDTSGNVKLYWDSSNIRLGINKASPSTTLDVDGTISGTTVDTTNLEVTNVKAKDGTAAITLADSTGVATLSANPILNAGTANGVPYLNASKVLTTGSALTFDGSIVSNTGVGFNVNNANALYRFQNGSGTRTGYFQVRADAFEIWSDQAAVPMVFGTSNTERMRLDASGNLGLGVTPSAWGSANRALQVATAGAIWSPGGADTRLSNNQYRNSSSSRVYIANGFAQEYAQDSSGNHVWLTAASGTAGNAITFSQVMTLDASGNLGVGTTSPSARLEVYDTSAAAATSLVQLTGQNGYEFNIQSVTSSNSTVGARYNFSINSSNGEFSWSNSGGERARITSGGDFYVGNTTTSSPGDGNTTTGTAIQAAGKAYFSAATSRALTLNRNEDGNVASFFRSGNEVGSISVTTTATAFNTSSDYRLKDNPQPLTNSGAFIDALKPKTWNWKVDGTKGVGFIAHEVQEVSPGSVVGTKDAVDEDGKPVMQAMEYGSAEFIANIIAELQSLRARVAQLEQGA
jgi:hypothetical protein